MIWLPNETRYKHLALKMALQKFFHSLITSIEVMIIMMTIKKITNIAIRTSYYIFCRRNKEWTDPELMTL